MGIVTSLLKHRARLRSEAKAHIKAQIKSAKAQAKEVGRQQRRADKNRDRLLARQEKSLNKQNSRGLKAKRRHERRMAKASLAKMRAGRFNRQNIVRYTAAGRMLAPIALPLLYRGVTFARAHLVAAKARRLGVTPDALAQFSGHGAALHSRIAGVSSSLEGTGLATGFVQDAQERLTQLRNAVDNAEYMTPEQRRRAHASITADIDALTGQIQERLARA